MADIGNQLEGAGEGLDRFLDALDNASIKMGSNAAIEARLARETKKTAAALAKLNKNLFGETKKQHQNLKKVNKDFVDLSKSMKDFAKKALGGIGKAIGNMAKAGALGAMAASVKLIADGLLRSDAAMAKLSAQTGMTRKELAGARTEAAGAQVAMSQFGITMENTLATAGNLVEAFGSAKYVTDELIQTATKLQMAYGLAADASANLIEGLTRANQSAEDFVLTVGSKATAAGVSASLVMRDLASRTQQMAMHGERGNDALIQMAITAAKAGTSMKVFDGMESAFGSIETIAGNMGDLTAKFGSELTASLGTAEEMYFAVFEGGQAAADHQEKILKTLSKNFSVSKKHGLVDAQGKAVAAGWQKKIAAGMGLELEGMIRMIEERDRYNEMSAAERKAEDANRAAQDTERKRVDKAMRSRMGLVKQLSSIWTGLYSTLTEQINLVFGDKGGEGLSAKIKEIGERLKAALNLKDFSKEVKEGGWANAIGKRLKTVLKGVIKEVFGVSDETAGMITSMAAPLVALAAASKAMSMLRGPRGSKNNPMFVTMGGPGGMFGGGGGGTKPRGAASTAYHTARDRGKGVASAAKSAAKQAGKGSAVKGLLKLGGKAVGKSLLKKIPLLGIAAGMYFAYNRIKGGDWLGGMMELGSGIAGTLPVVGTAAGAAIDVGLAGRDVLNQSALGRIGGGLSIVGEGGAGEVVASRSALRSGIGIGGRAASALAGIGVPGFREGYATMDTSGITGRRGLQGAAGSQSFRQARSEAFLEEQTRQQAAMLDYWRNTFDEKMNALVASDEEEKKKGPSWLKKAFVEYNAELAFVLDKNLGKNVSAGLMAGLTSWSEGGSLAESLAAGARAGILSGLQDEKSGLFKLTEKLGSFAETMRTGLQTWAEGGSAKDTMRAMAPGATKALAGKLFGADATAMASGQMAMGGIPGMGSGGIGGRGLSHMALRGAIGMQQRPEDTAAMAKTVQNLTKFGDTVGVKLSTVVTKVDIQLSRFIGAVRNAAASLQQPGSPPPAGGGMFTGVSGRPSTIRSSVMARAMAGRSSRGISIGNPYGAKGKYVNRPTLMMVGEGGGSEVVIPTDRIRKGLPINAGVAKELGSIGVPGFQDGGNVGYGLGQTSAMYPQGRQLGDFSRGSERFGAMGGMGMMGKAAGAGALMNFGNVYAQTGDWKQAGTAAVGGGIGMAAGMGLTAMGIPPPLSGMIGNAIGGLATKGLNKVFNITGGYGKGRRKVIKKLESHIKTGGRFDFGSPGGLAKSMGQAVGGYEKTPTEANFNKLVEKLGTSKLVASMGVPAPALIALAQGKMAPAAATKLYSAINTSLYGKGGGDKYRSALSVKAAPSLAAGGIVNRPTTALIGEAGPEAVIPLGNSEMMQEMKKQNKLMAEMIKVTKESGKTEIRMDGRLVAETVGQNMYDIGTGL